MIGKKLLKKIAMILFVVLLVNMLTGCQAFTAGVTIFANGVVVLAVLSAVSVVVLVIYGIVKITKFFIGEAPPEALDSIDNTAVTQAMNYLPQSKIDALTAAIQALPEAEYNSLVENLNSISEEELSFLFEDVNSLSETELAFEIKKLNDLPETEIISMAERYKTKKWAYPGKVQMPRNQASGG